MNASVRILIITLILTISNFAQATETFDISSFQPPKGWAKQVGTDAVQVSIEDKTAGTFCLISLYKSVPGLDSPKENFDAAWSTIVKENVKVSAAPEMIPADNKGEWLLAAGFASFEKDGVKGVAVLYTATGYGKMVNALVITNTQAYEPQATAFLNSISFKKPAENSIVKPPENNPIVGTWGQNLGAHMAYGDPVAAGMAGYSKDQYTFKSDGTYNFVSKTFRMSYDKIILVVENGTYQISGDTLAIKPQKSVIQAWSKLNGGDKWGRVLSSQPRKLEAVNYKFTKHYFSGIDEWNLVLQADQPTERDGPFSTFKLFPNAWYYKPISSNNPVVELPR
ncbi:MAG: hypothetical protein DMF63_03915 [Acidobacteria bacterium]|nr:MAG: hypothetical protein DMF63_03915 [Acidobacteriota bacterium]